MAMTDAELAATLATHENRIKVSEHRIDDLEKKQDKIETLTLSVQKLATSVEEMTKDQIEYRATQKDLASRLLEVEKKPIQEKASKLDKIAEYIFFAILGAFLTYLMTNLFGL